MARGIERNPAQYSPETGNNTLIDPEKVRDLEKWADINKTLGPDRRNRAGFSDKAKQIFEASNQALKRKYDQYSPERIAEFLNTTGPDDWKNDPDKALAIFEKLKKLNN